MNEIREAMVEAGYYDDHDDVELDLGGVPTGGPDECPLCPAELRQGTVPDHIRAVHSD